MSSPGCKRQKLADDVQSVAKMSNVSLTKDNETQTDDVAITVSASNKLSVINVNAQSFKDVANSDGFVDRTLLIEELLQPVELLEQDQDPTYAMMFAPSKFGKTVNLDMIRLFCDIEDKNTKTKEDVTKDPTMQELRSNPSKNMKVLLRQFEDTQYEECLILKREEFVIQHFGRHPVVFFNFKNCAAENKSEAIFYCAKQVQIGYRENKYLIKSKEFQSDDVEHVALKQICTDWVSYSPVQLESLSVHRVIDGLENLIEILRFHWGRLPVFLVDEIDKPCVAAMELRVSKHQVREIGATMTHVICSILKTTDEQLKLQAALLTGICNLEYGTLAPLDNTMPVYLLSDDRFSKYYGLTAQEVESLVRKFYGPQGEAEIEKIISDINANYNGYYQRSSSGKGKIYARYCLFSVLNYIEEMNKDKNKVNLSFWSDGGFSIGKLVPILKKSDGIMNAIHKLLYDDSGTIAIDYYERSIHYENILGLYREEMVPDPGAVLIFLLRRGYLAHNLEKPEEEIERRVYVRIPNLEIKSIYEKMFMDYHNKLPEGIKSKFTSCGQIFKSLPTQESTEFQESLDKLCEDFKCIFRYMQCKSEASICCHILAILKHYADYEKGEMEYAVQYFDNDNKPRRVYIDVWGRHGNFAVFIKVKYNFLASGELGEIGWKARSSLAAAEDIVKLLPDKINPEDRSINKAGTGKDLEVLKSPQIEHCVLVGLAVDGDYATHMLVFRDKADWENVIQVNPENHVAEQISTYLKSK